MPALRKPHRIAVLVPKLALEGNDAAYTQEVELLVWMTCIETLRRHPGLAVYDVESLPLRARDGHYEPAYAELGANPLDEFFAPTRRDELIWLELGLPRGALLLHTCGKAGQRQTFDAIGRTFGDQLGHVFGAWLTARGLPALPKKLDPIAGEDVLATIRVIGPSLVERARASAVEADPVKADEDIDAALDAIVPTGERVAVKPPVSRPSPTRGLVNRLPAALKLPALRTLELAFGEDLGEQILAIDPEHPQALFARWQATRAKDPVVLRRVIAAAPGWARPYGELRDSDATDLENLAGAGIAALCRPGQLDVIEVAALALRDDGRIDEGLRLTERVLRLYDDDPRAHAMALELARSSDRIGAWLAAAERAAALHGCCPDPAMPRYRDEIQIDLLLSEALLNAGRFDAAVTLRASRLEGVETDWPRQVSGLATWRDEPRFGAWCAAREAWFGGDPVRALDGFGRADLDPIDLAMFLDACVAVGRETEVPLAWALHGLGRHLASPASRLAAARGLFAAGEWRPGLEEMWRVELGEPGRDDQVALAHLGLLISIMPLEVAEAALADRVGIGAISLARRMARDIADFVPGAAKSAVVMRALGKPNNLEIDPDTLHGFSIDGRGRAAIDALFAEFEPEAEQSERRAVAVERRAARRGAKIDRPITVVIDPMVAADRLVNRWLEVAYVDGDSSPVEAASTSLARSAIYIAAQALGRYLAATTTVPSVSAGALRTVAAESLALVRRHRAAVTDRDVRALFGVIDPLLRRVDRWIGTTWLAAVERACGLDERSAGDLAGFAAGSATVAARLLGPEETAVLAASVARLHRERPDGWEAAASAQASRLALHTGRTGAAEWADATVAQLAKKAIELDDAIDVLLTAAYLAEDHSVIPCTHAARVLFNTGRTAAGFALLLTGLPAATPEQRDALLAQLGKTWDIDVPIKRDRAATETFEALQRRDPSRAERLGRWVVACDPDSVEAHRNLGLALAQQGKIPEALHHLALGTRDQATQILAGVLFQHGKLSEALAVLDHASRWYTTAEQWLGFAAIADAGSDPSRADRAYAKAFELDSEAIEPVKRERARASVGAPLPTLEPPFTALYSGDLEAVAEMIEDRDWRVRRAAIAAARHRTASEGTIEVTRRARAAAGTILVATVGSMDRDAVLCRMAALSLREQAHFARDPVPRLGDRVRPTPAPPRGPDRIVVPGSKVARVGEYVALLRDLAALPPREALAQFDLDDAGYLEVARAWTAAIAEDPTLTAAIAAGLRK